MKTKPMEDVGRLLTLPQAMEQLSCGRTKLYDLHQRGYLELVKLDRRTRVTERSVKQFLRNLLANKLIAPKQDRDLPTAADVRGILKAEGK
jgi:predicted DNA-binding transcriptional regulator AlpA